MIPSLDDLWNSTTAADVRFDPGMLEGLPEPARRYLAHAIGEGTPLASAVRLSMRGTLRLKAWKTFSAEEVIRGGRGFFWRAAVRPGIRGYDALVDGEAAVRWKLFGLIPVLSASGPDILRSAAGRYLAEAVWLPTLLLPQHGARWEPLDDGRAAVVLEAFGERARLELSMDESGRLRDLRLQRWGKPPGGSQGRYAFGGIVEEERRFDGFTIPVRMRIGWHFGTDRWSEGEFFRVGVEGASFR